MSKLQLNKSSSNRRLGFLSVVFVVATLIGANAASFAAGSEQRITNLNPDLKSSAITIIQDRLSMKSHGRIVSIHKSALDLSTLSQAAFGDRE